MKTDDARTALRNVFVNGAGVLANRDIAADLRDAFWQLRGQHVDITVDRHRDTRSQRANAYLWGVVYREMAAYTGQAVEDIHEAMVVRFLPSERKRVDFFNRATGERLEVPIERRRTSKLTGAAFFDYVEAVRLFAQEFLGVDTPDPDPEYWRAPLAAVGVPCHGE